ncbi:hypothetical protein FGO68_gene6480 [Halteria grandinella]|uniref:Uncharacterized protein n=1 Tax=Halteria grandinella TaxID=5974 RepID=A0A8J8T1X3_HALGN|nr:hypothetical protein FGO68_gene6480 [Halteria grandinella]
MQLRKLSEPRIWEDCADYSILQTMQENKHRKHTSSIALVKAKLFPRINQEIESGGSLLPSALKKQGIYPKWQNNPIILERHSPKEDYKGLKQFSKHTVTSTVKGRVIIGDVSPQKGERTPSPSRFIPVNPHHARSVIERQVEYDIDIYGKVSGRDERIRRSVEKARAHISPLKEPRVKLVNRQVTLMNKLQIQRIAQKSVQQPRTPLRSSIHADWINSHNDFETFIPSDKENPRLSILKNFKSINRVMRSSFLKNPQELAEHELPMFNQVKNLAQKMTGVMKQMHSVGRFKAETELKVKFPLMYSKRMDGKRMQMPEGYGGTGRYNNQSDLRSTNYERNLLNQDSTSDLNKPAPFEQTPMVVNDYGEHIAEFQQTFADEKGQQVASPMNIEEFRKKRSTSQVVM